AGRIRNLMSLYAANADLINIGAYKSGSNKMLDEAIEKMEAINEFLQQKVDDKVAFEQSVERMRAVVS
ncbi:MAG: EscN/YscN/HrcN family type III secretion system ATPase, partial [Clostridiales bacterium]|nr:EscN/YscN/HrcN family type III secretion system ATPase [Clostridiales bacterium]